MNNRECLNEIVKDLSECQTLADDVKILAEKIKKSSANPRLNGGRMSVPQVVAQKQAISKLEALIHRLLDMTDDMRLHSENIDARG